MEVDMWTITRTKIKIKTNQGTTNPRQGNVICATRRATGS
jgi:hypothetical protein